MRIKHNKFRNTGVLFELLVRQIASDTLANTDSKAVKIVKKFFTNSELAKEHKLYHTVLTAPRLSEGKAESLINATVDQAKKLKKEELLKEKYNLIKEIKEHYDLEEFFKAKIHNYKAYASIYNLIEAHTSLEFIDPTFVVDNKITLLEFLTKQNIDKNKVEDQVMLEYISQDKSTRALISKIMIEKFNEKYVDLLPEQREVLKTYINKISNTVSLRDYVNESFIQVKKSLVTLNAQVTDQRTQIKLKELQSIIKPIDKNESVKDEDVLNLLQFHELIHEIKSL